MPIAKDESKNKWNGKFTVSLLDVKKHQMQPDNLKITFQYPKDSVLMNNIVVVTTKYQPQPSTWILIAFAYIVDV